VVSERQPAGWRSPLSRNTTHLVVGGRIAALIVAAIAAAEAWHTAPFRRSPAWLANVYALSSTRRLADAAA
jgi:hypothetical protein